VRVIQNGQNGFRLSMTVLAVGFDGRVRHYQGPLATREPLSRVHSADYVEWIHASVPGDGLIWLDGDTAMNAAYRRRWAQPVP
jgi:hypothetical protein